MRKSELKKIIKECVREETQRRALVERTLNEDISLANVAIGSVIAILGVLTVRDLAIPLLLPYNKKTPGTWIKDKVSALTKAKKIAAKAEKTEKYSGIIQSIADKFKDDKKLASMLKNLDKVPHSDESKRDQRSKILKDIASHVKSKLEPEEAKYLQGD